MTADEIRKQQLGTSTVEVSEMLREIAAQLAELNTTLRECFDIDLALKCRVCAKPLTVGTICVECAALGRNV